MPQKDAGRKEIGCQNDKGLKKSLFSDIAKRGCKAASYAYEKEYASIAVLIIIEHIRPRLTTEFSGWHGFCASPLKRFVRRVLYKPNFLITLSIGIAA